MVIALLCMNCRSVLWTVLFSQGGKQLTGKGCCAVFTGIRLLLDGFSVQIAEQDILHILRILLRHAKSVMAGLLYDVICYDRYLQ